MKRVYEWYSSLPKRIRDSITVAITTVGFISTILSILGISLGDWEKSSFVIRIAVVLAAFVLIAAVAYLILGKIFNKSITLTIRPVSYTHLDVYKRQIHFVGTIFFSVALCVKIKKALVCGACMHSHGKKE